MSHPLVLCFINVLMISKIPKNSLETSPLSFHHINHHILCISYFHYLSHWSPLLEIETIGILFLLFGLLLWKDFSVTETL